MSLFLGKMCERIPGHKSATDHESILDIMPTKEVYIPLVAGNNTNFEILVNEGDQVYVGTKLAQTKTDSTFQSIQVFPERIRDKRNECILRSVRKITWSFKSTTNKQRYKLSNRSNMRTRAQKSFSNSQKFWFGWIGRRWFSYVCQILEARRHSYDLDQRGRMRTIYHSRL